MARKVPKGCGIALDNSLEALKGTLEEIVEQIRHDSSSADTYRLVDEAKFQYDTYLKLERQVVNSFLNNIITNKLIEGPRNKSRLEEENPYEKNFVIDYNIYYPKLRGRKGRRRRDQRKRGKITLPIDKKLERSINRTTDTKFTLNQILKAEGIKSYRQIEKEGIVIDINKSYTSIIPNYTNKFRQSKYFRHRAIDEIQVRYKQSSSLAEKLFDMMYEIDKIDLKNYHQETGKKNRKFEEMPDKMDKLKTIIPFVGDRVGIRLITLDEQHILNLGRELAVLSNPPQILESYYTGDEKYFNDDRIVKDWDGIVQAKPYLKIVEPRWVKPNGYQSLHINYRHCGSILELQMRTKEMHEYAESGDAEHQEYKMLEKLRREDFMNKNPETGIVLEALRIILKGIE